MMKKVRAPGMAFFLVALPVAVFAGFGVDRLLRREVTMKALAIPLGRDRRARAAGRDRRPGQCGARCSPSEQQAPRLAANARGAPDRRAPAAGRSRRSRARRSGRSWQGGCVGSRRPGRSPRWWWPTSGAWTAGSSTTRPRPRSCSPTIRSPPGCKQEPKPFRVLDVGRVPGVVLMAHACRACWAITATRSASTTSSWAGRTSGATSAARTCTTCSPCASCCCPTRSRCRASTRSGADHDDARVGRRPLRAGHACRPTCACVPAAAKLPEDQLVPTVIDPRFPVSGVVVFPESASVTPAQIRAGGPDTTSVRARLSEWKPGSMRVTLDRAATPRRGISW